MNKLVLSVNEIADLARFAGLRLDKTRMPSGDELETEIAIGDCPTGGLYDKKGENGKNYRLIAWYYEYPEEGSFGLGPELKAK